MRKGYSSIYHQWRYKTLVVCSSFICKWWSSYKDTTQFKWFFLKFRFKILSWEWCCCYKKVLLQLGNFNVVLLRHCLAADTINSLNLVLEPSEAILAVVMFQVAEKWIFSPSFYLAHACFQGREYTKRILIWLFQQQVNLIFSRKFKFERRVSKQYIEVSRKMDCQRLHPSHVIWILWRMD